MIKTSKGCEFPTQNAMIDKIISIGKADEKLPNIFEINCECGNCIIMDTHVYTCENCKTVYRVTPCSNDNIDSVVKNR